MGEPGRWLDWDAALITGVWRMHMLLLQARLWEQSQEPVWGLRRICFVGRWCIGGRITEKDLCSSFEGSCANVIGSPAKNRSMRRGATTR